MSLSNGPNWQYVRQLGDSGRAHSRNRTYGDDLAGLPTSNMPVVSVELFLVREFCKGVLDVESALRGERKS